MKNNRYSLQEMKYSAFTYYEIIDTYKNCNSVWTCESYTATIKKLDELNNNLLYNAEFDKWQTIGETIDEILQCADCPNLETALGYIDYALKIETLYTYADYQKIFAPYEN